MPINTFDMPLGIPVGVSRRSYNCTEKNIFWLDFYNGYGIWVDQKDFITYGDEIRIRNIGSADILLTIIRTRPLKLGKFQLIIFQSKWKTIVPYERNKEEYTSVGNKI